MYESMIMEEVLLRITNLRVHFPIRGGIFRSAVRACKAVDGVSLDLKKGQTLGLVGESGCGKSTLAKSVVKLVEPTSGSIKFKNQEVIGNNVQNNFRRSVQMVFQDPAESLNTRMTVGAILEEPLEIHRLIEKKDRPKRVVKLLEQVGLDSSAARRYPFEFSGGQRQRIGIARALALEPELLVLDEPVSALDVSVQSQVLNLLMELQDTLGLTYLLIAHDLAVVKHVSDVIAVMYLGKIVELGPAVDVYSNPVHAYTKALISAVPIPDPTVKREKKSIPGDVPSPINPPAGCAFGHRVGASRYQESVGKRFDMEEVSPAHYVLNCPCCI